MATPSNLIFLALFVGISLGMWMALVVLRGSWRSPAWCLMVGGTLIATLLPAGITASFLYQENFFALPPILLSLAVGSFVFAIGFVIHALQTARALERLAELEQLTAAMGEEISEKQREKKVG